MEPKFDPSEYDFGGWATWNDVECSDHKVIMKDAFKDNDGCTVPLVYNHGHNNLENVLGHALLLNRPEGVYTYGKFNDSEAGQLGKLLVQNGDITRLSIYANQLRRNGNHVQHGSICEVSIVLAGANPKATIKEILTHSDIPSEEEFEAEILSDKEGLDLDLLHSAELKSEEVKDISEKGEKEMRGDELSHADDMTIGDILKTFTKEEQGAMTALLYAALGGDVKAMADEAEKNGDANTEKGGKTVQEVFDAMSEEKKTAAYAVLEEALSAKESTNESENEEGEESNMKHNIFDEKSEEMEETLSHSDIQELFKEANRCGSLKEAFSAHDVSDEQIMHAVQDDAGNSVTYGIANIDYLFPDARNYTQTPIMISRDMSWVKKFMGAVHHTPFSRIKSIFADITESDARAKGYIKGNAKTDEVFGLLKRTTTPTTVYKKQKFDRDDIIDIKDMDTVVWIKSEMRTMLDEEIARAALVGDGRLSASDDKINPQNIRPIWTDDDLFTVKVGITVAANATDSQRAKAFIRAAIKSRKNYKGSGNPIMFTTEDMITDCLLMEDLNGRVIYETMEKLATALRVREIVAVPIMENQTRTDSDGNTRTLAGIMVNPDDYNMGADNGGAISLFDDFDIDYNRFKYLIETRVSGALTKPYSAVALEFIEEAEEEDDSEGSV